ncbi:class I SAM-dependent methyltransferase [Candidatus Neomarinimicrobiota bacterium]
MSNYDKEYKTENFFGNPYPELIEFFKTYKTKAKLLDLGCGQGRDAIPLARLGFCVTAIDLSEVGIKQIREAVDREGLNIISKIEDIYKYDSFEEFDFILLDSILHFYKKDRETETGLVKKIINSSKKGTIIVVCIQDSGEKVKILLDTINSTNKAKLIEQKSFKFKWIDKDSDHKSFSKYQMLAIEK